MSLLMVALASLVHQGVALPVDNLARSPSTVVCASGVNGARPLDDQLYGALNLFDGGRNIVNDLNYDYWLPGAPDSAWVYVRLANPAAVHEVALTLSPHYDGLLPEKVVVLHRSREENTFVRIDVVPSVGRQVIELGAPVVTMTELIVAFAGARRVDELEILGEVRAELVNPEPARPRLLDLAEIEPLLAEHLPVVETATVIEKEERERRIRSAYVESGETLTMSARLDWEWLARAAIADVDLENVTPDEIRARWAETYWEICGCYLVDYDVDKIPEQLTGFYYYVSSAGVVPAVPVRLRGRVMFKSVEAPENDYPGHPGLPRRDLPKVLQQHSGKVVFRVEGDLSPGGFIWFSDAPVEFQTTPVAKAAFEIQTVDGTTSAYRLLLPNGEQRERLVETREMEHVKETVAVYRLSTSTGQDVLFVQWAPDTKCDFMCCTHAYTLFDINDDLATLRRSFYGCDV